MKTVCCVFPLPEHTHGCKRLRKRREARHRKTDMHVVLEAATGPSHRVPWAGDMKTVVTEGFVTEKATGRCAEPLV